MITPSSTPCGLLLQHHVLGVVLDRCHPTPRDVHAQDPELTESAEHLPGRDPPPVISGTQVAPCSPERPTYLAELLVFGPKACASPGAPPQAEKGLTGPARRASRLQYRRPRTSF